VAEPPNPDPELPPEAPGERARYAVSPASLTVPPAPPRIDFPALPRNLLAGLRLLIPVRVGSDRFTRTFDQVAMLLVLNLLIWGAMDWLHSDPGAVLQLDGVFGWAAYLLTGLFGAALIARAQGRETDTRALLVPALSVAPSLFVVLWLLSDVPFVSSRPVAAVLVASVYLVYVGLRTVRAAYDETRVRALILAAVLIVAGPYVLGSYGLDTRLWLAEDTDQAQDDDVATAESLLYDQPARISAAVQRVAPAVPGKPHLFFVGFAGVGEQAVFKREALYAEQVFADKFGTGDR